MKNRILKNGSYYAALTAVLIAAVIVINLIAGSLPSALTVYDVTDTRLYSIGDTTAELLGGLTEDVTINVITQTGMEDEILQKLLDSYEAASDRVHVERIDAVANPAFASQYTDEQIPLNSVIVVCGEKSKVVSSSDIYRYLSYYSSSPDAFDGEGLITSAVAYVTGGSETVVYYTTGHGEFALGSEMTEALSKANIEVKELNLLSSEIPEDCTALISFAPTEDYTAEEARKVLHYLDGGGHALLVTAPALWTGKETPVFDTIAASYGIVRSGGVILEGDTSRYNQIPYLTVPQTVEGAEAVAGLGNKNILAPLAEALKQEHGEEDDETYSVQQLMTSSDSAYLKTSLEDGVDKSSGDETGPFTSGFAVEQTFSNDSDGSPDVPDGTEEEEEEDGGEKAETSMRLLYYSTPCLFSAEALSELILQGADLPQGNDELFSQTIKYLTDQEVKLSVPAKSMSVPQTTVNAAAVSLIGNLFMLALPSAVLAGGFFIWMRRRKR